MKCRAAVDNPSRTPAVPEDRPGFVQSKLGQSGLSIGVTPIKEKG